MVIVDHEIMDRVKRENLIDSFDDSCLTNIGYDLRAKRFYASSKGEESITLQPNESAFVESVEVVSMPTDMLASAKLNTGLKKMKCSPPHSGIHAGQSHSIKGK